VTGFTETFVMATAFLVVCGFAALLVPEPRTDSPAEARSSFPRTRTRLRV
jgi:hypothetical protein